MESATPERLRARVRGSLLAAVCGHAFGSSTRQVRPAAGGRGGDGIEGRLRLTEHTSGMLAVASQVGTVDHSAGGDGESAMWRLDRVRPLAATAAYPGYGLDDCAVVALRLAVVGMLPLPLPRVATMTRAGAGGADPVVVDSAVVAACAVALSLRTPRSRRIDRFEFTFHLGSECRDLALAERLARVGALADKVDLRGHLNFGTDPAWAVPAAVAAFLRYPDDPAAVVQFALDLGVDACVVGIAGAVAGARAGDAGLPPAWRQRLDDYDRICEIAYRLADLWYAPVRLPHPTSGGEP